MQDAETDVDAAGTAPEPDRLPGAPHPRETERLYGQERAERAFLGARAGGRLHHAWLIRGPEGVGKATLAYRIARAMIAARDGGMPGDPGDPGAPPSLDWPSDCPVGRRIRAQSEPRLAVIRRGQKDRGGLSAQIRIDEVRRLRRFLGLKAADGGWRVVIVDAADELNGAAANALLKELEEPPPATLMLLVAHAPGRLLPTIRSRCRTLDCAALGPGDLAAALAGAGTPVAEAEAGPLAALAGGSAGRAFRLIEADGMARYASLVGLFAGRRIDRPSLLALAEEAGARNAPVFDQITELTLTLLGRLARAGALGLPATAAAPGEPALMARVAATPAQARLWAEAAERFAAVAAQVQAVNLDPAQAILDMFLDLDATLGRAAGAR